MDLAPNRKHAVTSRALDRDSLADRLGAAQRGFEAHIVALERLRHADRVAMLGLLASSMAHELGNPLNVIELRAHLIMSNAASPQQAPKNAAVIVEQAQRMTRILTDMLSSVRTPLASVARLDLVGMLGEAVALSERAAREHEVRIVLDVSSAAVEIDGDGDKLLQIVMHLAANGVQAMPRGGTLRVSLGDEVRAAIDDPEGVHQCYVCIHVADDGVGIAPDLLSRVFEPLFSTRRAEGGAGLGLSVAQGIARQHDGWISVESEPGRGARFTVHLPKHGPRGDKSHGT